MPDFKQRLKEIRVEKKLLQKDIATFLEITDRAYQYYETGTRTPDFKGLIKLADYLDCSIDYLVGRSDNPTRQ